MRNKRNNQTRFDSQPSTLKLTNDYYAKFEAISQLLEETPRILELLHADLEAALANEAPKGKGRRGCVFTSEMVLRLVLCQILEGASL